jgi:hypothetical protein
VLAWRDGLLLAKASKLPKGAALAVLRRGEAQALDIVGDLLVGRYRDGQLCWGLAASSPEGVEHPGDAGPLEREKELIDTRRDHFSRVLQHSLPLFAADAMTPVFNERGELVGISIGRRNRCLGMLLLNPEIESALARIAAARKAG